MVFNVHRKDIDSALLAKATRIKNHNGCFVSFQQREDVFMCHGGLEYGH
jgi:hypothetical protein